MKDMADGRGFGAALPREGKSLGGQAPARKPKLRPLIALWPYAARYRGHIVAACAALVVASLATLAVPVAVRRMIDFGFSAERVALIDQYFAVMIAVVGVLAAASALRYYFVTILGERVVADLRAAVFAHLTLLSAAFFDAAKTGGQNGVINMRDRIEAIGGTLAIDSWPDHGTVVSGRVPMTDAGRPDEAASI